MTITNVSNRTEPAETVGRSCGNTTGKVRSLASGALISLLSATVCAQFVPGGVETVNLNHIVADTVLYNTNTVANLANWEPYSSVLGTNTFLMVMNTFAEGTEDSQRLALAFQPVAGGPVGLGDVFFDDAGKPYRGVINASRQDGNPGRVAGDARPGAVNFLAGA